MTIEQALEQIEWWEAEDEHEHPTRGSEDEMNIAGCFTHAGKYVVYSYFTQGQILSERYLALDVLEAAKAVKAEAADGEKAEFELWREHKSRL